MAAVLSFLTLAWAVLVVVLAWIVRMERHLAAIQRDIHWLTVGLASVGLLPQTPQRKR